jgi:hypothetical protein
MNDTRTAKLVCFGRGGDSVEYGGGCHGSGYGTPESPHAAAPSATCIIPDGTYAVDKRPALETAEGYSWVFKGPMCNPDIPDGECDPCPVPSDLFASAVAENEYGQLLTLNAAQKAAGHKRSGLDSVSIAEYVQGWREHGARIGQYVNGQIVWES